MTVSTGAFGQSVIEVDGSTNGMQRRIMRPKESPFVMVEVIDGGGHVSAQRCDKNVYWRELLEGQGGDPTERAAKGRKNANRIVVAVLQGGPGVLTGEALQAARRKHGYEVIPNAWGLANCYEGPVEVRDKNTGVMLKVEGCGRGIKILDQNAPIAQRRREAENEVRKVRAERMARNMDQAQAAAAVLTGGMMAPQQQVAGGISAEQAQALLDRMAKLEADLAAARAQQSATAAPLPEDDDEDAPPPPPAKKGK